MAELSLKDAFTIVEAALKKGRGVIGAVGISGDVSDKDETCDLAGTAAAHLTGDTG